MRLRPLAAALLLATAACSSGPGATTGGPGSTTPASSGLPAASASPEPGSTSPSGPQPLPPRTATARSLRIPAIGVRSPLVPLRLEPGGALEAPEAWDTPGWYVDGAVPGDTGPAVVAGHVDSPDGPAVFWRLRELRIGQEIEVERSDGRTVTFVVTRNEQFEQADFPTGLVYGPTPGHELRLITCDGIYDRKARRYLSNRVVFAVEASQQLTIG